MRSIIELWGIRLKWDRCARRQKAAEKRRAENIRSDCSYFGCFLGEFICLFYSAVVEVDDKIIKIEMETII